jgi:hypothetical protein
MNKNYFIRAMEKEFIIINCVISFIINNKKSRKKRLVGNYQITGRVNM